MRRSICFLPWLWFTKHISLCCVDVLVLCELCGNHRWHIKIIVRETHICNIRDTKYILIPCKQTLPGFKDAFAHWARKSILLFFLFPIALTLKTTLVPLDCKFSLFFKMEFESTNSRLQRFLHNLLKARFGRVQWSN